jgi:hypothetical protein
LECGAETWWPEHQIFFNSDPQLTYYAKYAADEINANIGREFIVITDVPSNNKILIKKDMPAAGRSVIQYKKHIVTSVIYINAEDHVHLKNTMKHEMLHAIGLRKHSENVEDLLYYTVPVDVELFLSNDNSTKLRCLYTYPQ